MAYFIQPQGEEGWGPPPKGLPVPFCSSVLSGLLGFLWVNDWYRYGDVTLRLSDM